MNKFSKLILSALLLFIFISSAKADVLFDKKIERITNKLDKTQTTVSILIKNNKTGLTYYKKNEKKLLNPASVQKLVTTLPAIEAIGNDYIFKTTLYKDKSNNAYIKLGADPYFKSTDLKILVKEMRAQGLKKIENFYVDDSIIDAREWGTGWMWDDNTNPLMPKFSAYNMNGNIFQLELSPSTTSACANCKINAPNNFTSVVNKLKTSKQNNIDLKRYDWISPDITFIDGEIATTQTLDVPVPSPRRYFMSELYSYMNNYNIKYYNSFKPKLVPKDAICISEIVHPSSQILDDILKDSDNMVAETVFKIAGQKKYNQTGTFALSQKLFNEFYKELGVKTDDIVIADASGVSRNNLMNSEFICDVLQKLYNNKKYEYYVNAMAKPNQGTLSNRLFDLRDNLRAKTGTLSNVSGIAGYLTTKDKKDYSFVIFIENFTQPQKEVKEIENEIINTLYES